MESVAAQCTIVLPSGKRLPDLGWHETGTAPSTPSVDVTLKVTRARFAPLCARTVFEPAPCSIGAVTSNSRPGTSSVPVQVSVSGAPGTIERCSRVPLPDAAVNRPVPPAS
jgi:hypothetical protein